MEFCFGLLHTRGSKTSSSWISLTFLCSMLCIWSSVDCWSYIYSNSTMKWEKARTWCQTNYTDLVAIQNQEEIEYLKLWLPKKPSHYWIGIRKVNNVWTWVGTNKALTEEATNWDKGEPNNGQNGKVPGLNEDCVEMYIKRDKGPGKWNDERCSKLKTALCYTAACKNDSCLHGDCVETINSHKCVCHEGFYGEKCEHVVLCNKGEVFNPHKGKVHCTHKYEDFSFNSSCQYSCEEGYLLSAQRPQTCTALGKWSEQPPTCELVQCQKLSPPSRGSMQCSSLGSSSYNSTCVFSCVEGYVIAGSSSNTLQCEGSGNWNDSQPYCAAVQCPDLKELENGVVNCGDNADLPFSYGNTCSFRCSSGYRLVGTSRATCTSAAEWSEKMPHCEAITCKIPEGDAHLITKCSQPVTDLRSDSTCSFKCEDGFELQGANTIQCSEDGQWSTAIPTCRAVRCPFLKELEKGEINCSNSEQEYNSHCSFICSQGYSLEGHDLLICDRNGNWTGEKPTCQDKAQKTPTAQITAIASGVAAGGTLLSGLSLAMWILRKLKQKANKFELNSNSEIEPPPQTYKNSIDSLICSFLTEVTFGWTYHYSTTTMNWTAAREWCQERHTDMVVIQNQDENNYLVNKLPIKKKYYWIGITKQHKNETWTWIGNNSTWIGNESWAANEPNNDHSTEFCVEIYVNNDANRGKWNDEKCANKKYAACYKDLSSREGAQAWSYNISSNRRWLEARQWCQQHFTDMVSIRNQEENDFLNKRLLFLKNYYWIGIKKEEGEWIWAQNKNKVPQEAQNWAQNEPDNVAANNCVEIYIKRDTDPGKWNNEPCHRRKGTLCYAESCTKDSCNAHADCVETIGNYTCKCHPGFTGSSCQEAIACKPLLDPEHGSHSYINPYGFSRFNSSCHFQCELGFQLVGVSRLLCQASGQWNHPVPLCRVKKCPDLDHVNISSGNMNCSHPVAHYSYNSTCEVRCDEGYELRGQDQIRCDHTGKWTGSVPACTVKKCSPIRFPVPGDMSCVDTLGPFSFGSKCNFTCQEGYNLTGDNTLTCLASGQWSNPTPTCKVVQCNSLKDSPYASMQCQDPLAKYSYGSMCTVKCVQGFDMVGANMTKCLSQGNWSHEVPFCQAKMCLTRSSPSHGFLNCSGPHGEFRFGSHCTSTCEKGFVLNGTADTECNSLGMWSSRIPRCLAQPCPLLVKAPHGRMNCSHPYLPFSFGSLCDFECNEGFRLKGKQSLTCNTSGHWSQDLPTCQPVQCGTPRALSLILSMNCSHPLGDYSFGSQCNFTCKEGFSLKGTEVLFCSSGGLWNDNLPHCTVDGMPLGTALLTYTGVGAASVAVPLLLIGLAFLIIKRFKKRGDAIVSDSTPWGDRENPAFEF
ncbi:P-selectin-like [Labrus mixtus]|uniref:P-selectin-like n=1 Tax=Labrus mixtus TaxID=508554 RepID=UPI0029BFF703|nr:P-selectin-like [Labrus mixtus]